LGSSTAEVVGARGPVGLGEAPKAFAMSVEVVGLRGDGQALTDLEDVSGGKGWRLSVVRLVKGGGVLGVQAVCVVSKAIGGRRGVTRPTECKH
jgi:hypothetical protein